VWGSESFIFLNNFSLKSSRLLCSDIRISDLRNKIKCPIYLVGSMGCGKSTIGKNLAQTLGYQYIDTDEIATSRINMSIASFFELGHESEFRNLETEILTQLSKTTDCIVSTGGGIVSREENRNILKSGLTIFLNVPPTVIYERLRLNRDEIVRRPLLQSSNPQADLIKIFNSRKDYYEQAHLIIDLANDKLTIKDSVLQIVESLHSHFKNK